jgi:hypothetical protein
MNWTELHKRFKALMQKTGASKTSSYALDVGFDAYGEITVHLGTYDIADWPRHTYLGPFKTEEEAMLATSNKIDQAEAVVSAEYWMG